MKLLEGKTALITGASRGIGGWHKQAVWYENKLKLIKEGEEDCESFYQNLHEIAFHKKFILNYNDINWR